MYRKFIPGDECYMSYLPAAHVLEFTAQLVFFCYGAQIGYACPKTISSKVQHSNPTIKPSPSSPTPQRCAESLTL